MAPGVVLTGGTSLLNGIGELGEQILDLPIRVGYPNTVGGLSEIVKSPLYATAVGLILYGRKHVSNGTHKQGYKNIFTRITQSTKNWLAEVI
jgi:cell division protein FtsA